jgi:hypothetical protein
MRLWLLASVALGALLAQAAAQAILQKKNDSPPRHNEVSLAQLRPGKDSLADAVMRYGPKHRPGVADSDDVVAWVDPQRKIVLRIELNDEARIDSVTLASIDPLLKETSGTVASLPARGLTTGRGLALGASKARVLELYGPPGNTGPSTMEGHELEFMFYAFDWAGPDVPQVMEVTCERVSGRVVKITLAFPSL